MNLLIIALPLTFVLADDYELGKMSTIKTKEVHYAIRVPKSLDKAKGAPAIVFIHGSNMRGEAYVGSLETARDLDDWVLIGPTGPHKVNDEQYNHDPGDEKYVASVISDVEQRLKIKLTRIYVGGHSQGAFLSHAVAAHIPETIDGVLAVSGGAWVSPRKLERKGGKKGEIPIAIVHGQDDPVVAMAFSSIPVYDAYVKAGHGDVRLFAPAEGAHMFMRLPILQAWGWLELLNEKRRDKAAEILSKADPEKDPRTAWDAAHMVKRLDKGGKSEAGDRVIRSLTAAGKKKASDFAARLQKAKSPLDPKLIAEGWTFLADYGMVAAEAEWRKVFEKARK
jgi:predicted esterase